MRHRSLNIDLVVRSIQHVHNITIDAFVVDFAEQMLLRFYNTLRSKCDSVCTIYECKRCIE